MVQVAASVAVDRLPKEMVFLVSLVALPALIYGQQWLQVVLTNWFPARAIRLLSRYFAATGNPLIVKAVAPLPSAVVV